jgi:uncharacterized protein (TIGR02118 family)
MITRVGMAPRAAGLSYASFQEHWRSEHAGLAGQLPGLRGYVQNHSVLGDGRPLLPYPGFDACSELQFDSLAAMDDAFASAHYLESVTADEHALIDKARFALILTERRVLLEGEVDAGAVKLLTFLPVDPRSTRESLTDVLAGTYHEIVVEAEPLRHELLLEIPGAHEGRLPAVSAAVDILWFPSVEQALGFVQGAVGHRAGYALAGTAFGLERVLARTIRVLATSPG